MASVTAIERPGATWQRLRQRLEGETAMGYMLVTPAMLLILCLVVYPFMMAVWLSVSDARVGNWGQFIGFGNYVYLFGDELFLRSIRNTFLFTFSSVALKLVLGLGLALLLNKEFVGQRFVRGAILLPWVIPAALSTIGWMWMFDPLFSVFNWTLRELGLSEDGVPWLGRPGWAMFSVILVNTWRGLPFFAICFLAGLVSIPKELYEAAEIDGAGPIAKFWYITLPMLKPVMFIVILFSAVLTFSNFEIIYILTQGGPVNSTHVFATLAHTVGLISGNLGRGAAISMFMFPVLLLVVFITLGVLRKDDS